MLISCYSPMPTSLMKSKAWCPLLASLESGADVCLGYREEDYYASVPWFRKGLSESFRFVLKTILKFPITDTQCGLKGMGKKGKSIFMETRIDRFLVDMEFIKLAVNQNANIKPVVVSLRPTFNLVQWAQVF